MSSSSSSSINTELQHTLTPGRVFESELVVKKSRFLALAKHAGSWAEAKAFVEETKLQHPKARHWCTAFRGVVVMVESDNSNTNNGDASAVAAAATITERCNDDGEPSGTAGQPILNALQTEGDLVNAVCVVVRYFGGIKLGAGGLIRAYGEAARQVLREAAPHEVVVPTSNFVASKIAARYVGAVYDCVSKFGGTTADESYDEEDGSLTLSITCEFNAAAQIQDTLKDATRGEIHFGS